MADEHGVTTAVEQMPQGEETQDTSAADNTGAMEGTIEVTEPQAISDNGEAATEGMTAPDGSPATMENPSPSAPRSYAPQRELSDALSSVGEVTERKDVPDGRAYEIIYIVRPDAADASDTTSTRVRSMIEDGGGAVDNVRTSEVRRLAYPIKKQIEGTYVVINARFKTDATAEIERFFKLEDSILRHMMIKE